MHPFPWTASTSFGRWAKLWEGDLLFCHCRPEIQGGVWKLSHTNPWRQPKRAKLQEYRPNRFELTEEQVVKLCMEFYTAGHKVIPDTREVLALCAVCESPSQSCDLRPVLTWTFLLDKPKPQLWDETLLGAPEVDSTFCQRTYHPISYTMWQQCNLYALTTFHSPAPGLRNTAPYPEPWNLSLSLTKIFICNSTDYTIMIPQLGQPLHTAKAWLAYQLNQKSASKQYP